MASQAEQFMLLFAGYMGAYGTYAREEHAAHKNGKLEIKSTARTVREPITELLWQRHLKGVASLGVIPIDEHNCCRWGVIDYDKYDTPHAEIFEAVERAKLPLVVCRSKSGGAHLFLFLREPAPAAEVSARLREMSSALSLGNCEVFPKQNQVLLDRGDLGSWLNMPYFGGEGTGRYAIKRGGMAMTVNEFLRLADLAKIDHEELSRIAAKQPQIPAFADGPPCLQYLATTGIPEGGRNNGLTAMSIYARKRYGDKQWEAVVDDYNRKFMKPPLGSEEVAGVIKSTRQKDYNYSCKTEPIASHCNSTVCRMRKFGIRGSDDYPVISGMSVLDTDPPLWFLDIEGVRLELNTDDLQNYKRFHKICIERLTQCYRVMKQDTWYVMVQESMKDCVRIEAPPEVSVKGQMMEHLEDFLMNTHRGRSREDILSGRPWEDESRGRHYFRLRDLMEHFDRQGFNRLNRGQMTTRLKDMGGEANFMIIKGKGTNLWWLPSSIFSPTPEIPTPELKEDVV